ncbi:hypothetical protein GCM10007860_13140 [Chitiniphilus shinanonensis]|uniref:Uncharacterized protein n=1 Tax=Chitiniphilus shinanonensis TaxID=553088 RepID=A0ABQ6BRC5_9NEIS|nr:hypothetical protein GCM10007860_13140 [Chitiniphilus shinanonensis]
MKDDARDYKRFVVGVEMAISLCRAKQKAGWARLGKAWYAGNVPGPVAKAVPR